MGSKKNQRDEDERGEFIKHTLSLIPQMKATLSAEPSRKVPISPSKILVIGMGGSAICGDVVADMMLGSSPIPMAVVRSIHVPAWVDGSTLVVAISYSGDTLETLTAMEDASKRGASICGICSGGRLLKLCNERELPHIRVPGGMMPRAALGSLLGACARLLDSRPFQSAKVLSKAMNACEPYAKEISDFDSPLIDSVAKGIARSLPVIYATAGLLSAARRFKGELNENAKMLAYFAEFPESAHNDIVGLTELVAQTKGKGISPITLRLEGEEDRIVKMYEAFEAVVGKRFLMIEAPFEDTPSSLLYHILVGDAVSLKVAEMRGKDPSKIEPISEFKRRMWF
jgi:glucose/mannose-6-phosphate isomerase